MKRRKKHTPKNPASARPRKRNIGESEPVRRPASKAPPPINTVGVSYRPHPPKPLQMPIHLPLRYPEELKQTTRKIIAEAIKEFPVDTHITRQTQITKMCKRVVSRLTPDLCVSVQDEALSVMDELLHYILVTNCDYESERERIKQETMESEEWAKLIGEMAGVPSAAVNNSSDTHLQKPKRRGRPSTDKRLTYERAATYKDAHEISWSQLARKYFRDEHRDDPKRCSDRVRMGVIRVRKAKRS